MSGVERLRTDILILGSGGAGLFAALHARRAAPEARITIAVKGLLGKCGCTRMVQGGYNVALAPGDSVERHFMDTIEGGKWLNHQELAWTLVTGAQATIRELENEVGCFFDRNPDGTVHQKAFAGQTFDRTVHKGDLTGIEIINRLAEQVWRSGAERLEDHRALALVPSREGDGLSGVLAVDMRSGALRLVQAKAVLLATGGGPTMYRYHTPSGDKSCDGMAMALAAGLPLRDLEMVQFHPTGLLAGPDTRMTGTVLEEGLRGAGGWLLGGDGERFMHRYDDKLERATRDIVSRAIYQEMLDGNVTPMGGVYIQMSHLGADAVGRQFKGMVERCADCGFDLAGGRVEVVPTAHYMMGGIEFEPDCRTTLDGLYVAGEDSGGVHGANRLGGNGVANSTVFGRIAGRSMGEALTTSAAWREPDGSAVDAAVEAALAPLTRPGHGAGAEIGALRDDLCDLMWERVGILRDATGMTAAMEALAELEGRLDSVGLGGADRAFNLTWHDWLNLKSLVGVSRAITAAAIAREDSRGAHYRTDHPRAGALENSAYTRVRLTADGLAVSMQPVHFTRVHPGGTLIGGEESAA
jgi:fumarate reductase flavoprotein subunit